MRFPIVHTELSIFLSSYSTPLIPWVGKSPNKWLSNVGSLMAHHVSVPAAAPSRKTLYSFGHRMHRQKYAPLSPWPGGG